MFVSFLQFGSMENQLASCRVIIMAMAQSGDRLKKLSRYEGRHPLSKERVVGKNVW
jgi:hypothetical protein